MALKVDSAVPGRRASFATAVDGRTEGTHDLAERAGHVRGRVERAFCDARLRRCFERFAAHYLCLFDAHGSVEMACPIGSRSQAGMPFQEMRADAIGSGGGHVACR